MSWEAVKQIYMTLVSYPPGHLYIESGTEDRDTSTMSRGTDTKNDCSELEVYQGLVLFAVYHE